MKRLHNILHSTPRYSFINAATLIMIQHIFKHKNHCEGSESFEDRFPCTFISPLHLFYLYKERKAYSISISMCEHIPSCVTP